MNEPIKKSIWIEVITDAVIIWLPIDLLYLYFANGWCEPNQLVLHTELALLFLLPAFGIFRLLRFIKTSLTRISIPQPEEESDRSGQ